MSDKRHLEPEVRRTTAASPWTYEALDAHQQLIRERVARGLPGRVLLSEVDPVVTLGRRGEFLGQKPKSSLPIYLADRGGYETYHGPGQWVLFVVTRLEEWAGHRTAVRRAVERLLEVGLKAAENYRSDVTLDMERPGLWVPEGKLASVGISVRSGVLQHGLALNVFKHGDVPFGGLAPCGLQTDPAFLLDAPDESAFQDVGYRLIKAAW